jgi:hypothetical protein
MGYAKLGQKGKGIHLRQFARAFIIDDGKERLAFVSVDGAMMGNGLRREVSSLRRAECTANTAVGMDCVNVKRVLGRPKCRWKDHVAEVLTTIRNAVKVI